MQAMMSEDQGVTVVRLTGRIDVETAEPFRRVCFSQLSTRRVVFDFRGLNFVGSSGIVPFLKVLQDYSGLSGAGFKFSGVGSEFRKVFSASPLSIIETYDTYEAAVNGFINPQPIPVPVAVQAVPMKQDQDYLSLQFEADDLDSSSVDDLEESDV